MAYEAFRKTGAQLDLVSRSRMTYVCIPWKGAHSPWGLGQKVAHNLNALVRRNVPQARNGTCTLCEQGFSGCLNGGIKFLRSCLNFEVFS